MASINKIEKIRPIFEKSVYEQYRDDATRAALLGGSADIITKQKFLTMKPNGQYAIGDLNFAFTGYCLGVRDVMQNIEIVESEGSINEKEKIDG